MTTTHTIYSPRFDVTCVVYLSNGSFLGATYRYSLSDERVADTFDQLPAFLRILVEPLLCQPSPIQP